MYSVGIRFQILAGVPIIYIYIYIYIYIPNAFFATPHISLDPSLFNAEITYLHYIRIESNTLVVSLFRQILFFMSKNVLNLKFQTLMGRVLMSRTKFFAL
jgi:hypothetical protein